MAADRLPGIGDDVQRGVGNAVAHGACQRLELGVVRAGEELRVLGASAGARNYVAVRGGIVDIYPAVAADAAQSGGGGEAIPVRVEFFGDEIDRISEIDSAQQGLDRLATSLTGITEQFSRSGFGALSANNPTNTSVEAAAEA